MSTRLLPVRTRVPQMTDCDHSSSLPPNDVTVGQEKGIQDALLRAAVLAEPASASAP